MVSWEYEYIRHNLHKAFIDELNKAGTHGWELVAVEKDAQHYYMGFMKRPIHKPEASATSREKLKSIPDNRKKAIDEAARPASANRVLNAQK